MSAESNEFHGEDEKLSQPPKTRWSLVLNAAHSPDKDDRRQALEQLCQTYYKTLYRFARKRGQSDDEAWDSVHEFICALLEGKKSFNSLAQGYGLFRSFLKTCFDRFLVDQFKASKRQKVGGDLKKWSFDLRETEGYSLMEPVENLTPEDAYRKSIALDTFQEALEQLQTDWAAKDKDEQCQHLIAYLSEDCKGEKSRTLARQLGVAESSARRRVSDFRKEFRGILRDKVTQTLSDPTEKQIDNEVDWLWHAFDL